MTSKKVLLSRRFRGFNRGAIVLACTMSLLWGGGCSPTPRHEKVVQPRLLESPYPAPKAWAVLPFRNESGTSLVDGTAFADRLTQQIQQIEGVTVLPVNRVIETIFQGETDVVIDSVEEIYQLINRLEVDGVIVGTLTAWDPYTPPKIGVIAQLYTRQHDGGSMVLDTRRMSIAASANDLPGVRSSVQPVTQVGSYFDAANGEVLHRLQEYATGRVPIDGAADWRRYVLSMDLFSEYVSYELMRRFFASEWERLNPSLPPVAVESVAGSPVP